MARTLITSVPNFQAATGEYPSGRVQNESTGVTGTAVVEELYGDVIQFFEKIVRDASITKNNLADNETNGYQLVEALDARISSVLAVNLSVTRTATIVTVQNSGGDDAVLPAATNTQAGIITATVFENIQRLSQGLSVTRQANTLTVVTQVGDNAQLPAATNTQAGLLLGAEKQLIGQLSVTGNTLSVNNIPVAKQRLTRSILSSNEISFAEDAMLERTISSDITFVFTNLSIGTTIYLQLAGNAGVIWPSTATVHGEYSRGVTNDIFMVCTDSDKVIVSISNR